VVVALDVELLGQQRAVAGRLLPVDGPAVHAGAEVGQGVEVAAAPKVKLQAMADRRIAREQPQGLLLDGGDVQSDGDHLVQRVVALLPGQA
jgi:hypothetical protein